ncbi:MAG TPA: acyl-CoA dehydrogenase family protein [Streptosporangiaceae bacterium]|nr:acyl-CoA dehydrogenase family protein [Streptosporangiaceae bacterium]
MTAAEQQDLRDAVRGLLAAAGGEGGAWGRLCREVGVAGLAIPERYGGTGAGAAEVGVVMEELGRGLTPSPMLGSAVLAAQALLGTGDEAACERLLPAIADGSATAALAWTTRAGRWSTGEVGYRASQARGGWELDGEAHYVLDGERAGVLLVAARGPAGAGLFEVDPGQDAVSRTASVTMDSARALAVVRLTGARGSRVGGDATGALERARDLACLALAAEQAGAARRALELTVGYALTRVQFGRVIGSFQALQHRMADLHVLVESAASLSRAAAAEEGPGLGLRAAAAKVYCCEAAMRTAAEMIQLHGAIGITWEHPAHRYLKRAHGALHLFGGSAQHTATIAATLIDS